MKFGLCAVVVMVCLAAFAEDITTLDGKVYKDVRITRSDETGITVVYAKGITHIQYAELSDEIRRNLQKTYGGDEDLTRNDQTSRSIVSGSRAADDKANSSVSSTSGDRTATGKQIYTGPRGGRYHYGVSGKKVYEKRKR